PPPVQAAPSGIIVGAPEPQPDNFRTVQMAPADLAALGIDPATLPPVQPVAKKTMMGLPAPILPPPPGALRLAPTAELHAQHAPPKAAPQARPPQGAYTPPPKGSFGPFSRALAFMQQIFALASQHKALFKPLVWDVLLTTPIMAAFTVLEFFVHSANGFYALMGVEAFLLYFVDYACNSITASLIYDYATTGEASMQTAIPRVKKALPGVLTFAAVSALL